MLHEFLTSNRNDLIRRCRAKVSRRAAPPVGAGELEYGVPLLLEQLAGVLRDESESSAPKGKGVLGRSRATLAAAGSSRTAGLHGKELLERGYTVEQVVHDYGDICQSLTELAREKNAPITVEEFRALDRLLDNAIADTVSSYGLHREASSLSAQADQVLRAQGSILAGRQRELLETALKALDAIKVGNIGVMGATGALLEDSLKKLCELADESHPESQRPGACSGAEPR